MTAERTLDAWLERAEQGHPGAIELGLTRVGAVAERLGFAAPAHRPAPCTVIVAGTNGKGSTCIALEALLRAAGLRVGTTLSPHVHRFNERVRIDGREAADATLCSAFARVDAARADTPLTYFEYATLVALLCFRDADVDAAILEVGLGGRLDAFNIVAADLAIVTSIGLDHQDYLGDDLESIGREKAGVFRRGQAVVLGADVSRSVRDAAATLDCAVTALDLDFQVRDGVGGWDFSGSRIRVAALPHGGLAPDNCALAIEAASRLVDLEPRLVAPALAGAVLPGRCELLEWPGSPPSLVVVDVAHNPPGARFLAALLARRFPGRTWVALLGMLADKDAPGVVAALDAQVDMWVCVTTTGARGQSAEALAERLPERVGAIAAGSAEQGLAAALAACPPRAAILAVGSFNLVEQVRGLLVPDV